MISSAFKQQEMIFDPKLHHRRSIRLPDHDYSQSGAYFITMVPRGRECLFGTPQNGEMQLNSAGRIVLDVWNSRPLVVGFFKMNTAKQINKMLGSEGVPVWQRNYYENIIRNEAEHDRIHSYIGSYVANWVMDNENPLKSA
jgi:putative transposase